MKSFIVIPGYNEEKHVGALIGKLKQLRYNNIIFVNDGSKDKSAEKAEKAGAIVLNHKINLGKGAAAKTGCDYAVSIGADIICLMDADGQHMPEDVGRLIHELKKTKSDIVFGYRKIDKNMPIVMKLGNWFINNATEIIQGIKLLDTQSGFRCFTSKAYKKIRWTSNDYSMESEMIYRTSKNNLKYSQIEIKTVYLDDFKGTTIFDGIKIFINIIKFKIFGGNI